MSKNLVLFYSVAICVISSIILIFTITSMLSAAADFTFLAKYKHSCVFNILSANTNYRKYIKDSGPTCANESFGEFFPDADSPEENITSYRLYDLQDYKYRIKNDAIKLLIHYSSWVITASLFFFIHWKLYHRREK